METIITEIAGEFIKKICAIIASGEGFAQIEEKTYRETKVVTARILGAYAEAVDAAIAADRTSRRKTGHRVERRGDERRLQTLVGEVSYRRTYYAKASGGYEYLTDSVLGVDKRERVSEGLSLSLIRTAKDMSYGKASEYLTGGAVSRQTVMEKIRRSYSRKTAAEPRRVAELHIDADEDHVTMVGGRKSIVPLISVYEGIEKQGTRGFCRNVFHISEYGKSADELWEQALTEVESRYDLEGTRIYLHGDGAEWIKTGLEWFPNVTFVLDKYHKNKAIKTMTAGLSPAGKSLFDYTLRNALSAGETSTVDSLASKLSHISPERTAKITESAEYLKKHVKGIRICATDPSANNGGCTEPHVSHILSARLSSRPMAWSKQTLERFVPILAGGTVCRTPAPSLPVPLKNTAESVRKAFKNTKGLPAPSAIGRLPLNGKITGTQTLLRHFV